MATPTTEQRNATRESARDMSSSEAQAHLTPLTPSTSPLIPTAPLIPGASAAKPLEPLTPVSQPAIVSSAIREYGWSWPLRILGMALALVGGAAVGYVLRVPMLNSDIRLWLFALGLVIWAALVAGLVQSFWAVLLVPGLSIIGLFVGNSMHLYGSDVLAWFTSGLAEIDSAVVLIIVLWLFGAFIGAPFGMWIEQRLRS